MKSILVLTDFSLFSAYAASFGADLAKKTNAELSFIHFMDIPDSIDAGYYLDYQVVQQLSYDAESKMKQLRRRYGQDIEVNTFLIPASRSNRPEKSISGFGADLIIFGSRKEKSLKNLLSNSMTEGILRNSSCPVLSISGQSKLKSVQNALIVVENKESLQMGFLTEFSTLSMHLNIKPTFLSIERNSDSQESEAIQRILDSDYTGKYKIKAVADDKLQNELSIICKDIHPDMLILHNNPGDNEKMINDTISDQLIRHVARPTLIFRTNSYSQSYLPG